MHRLTSTWQQRNGRGDIFCICTCVQQRGFRQRNRHRVWAWPRPQNWFRLLFGNRDMDPLWKVHFHVTHPTFNALYDQKGAISENSKIRVLRYDCSDSPIFLLVHDSPILPIIRLFRFSDFPTCTRFSDSSDYTIFLLVHDSPILPIIRFFRLYVCSTNLRGIIQRVA